MLLLILIIIIIIIVLIIDLIIDLIIMHWIDPDDTSGRLRVSRGRHVTSMTQRCDGVRLIHHQKTTTTTTTTTTRTTTKERDGESNQEDINLTIAACTYIIIRPEGCRSEAKGDDNGGDDDEEEQDDAEGEGGGEEGGHGCGRA